MNGSGGVPPIVWFFAVVLTMLLGRVVHQAVDRSPKAGTRRRRCELGLLWIVVGSGFWIFLAGVLYLDVTSQLQWEVAWSDIALGLLLMGCALERNRDGWMNAAVLATLVLLGSDAVSNGWVVLNRGNLTSVHVWSGALEVIQCVLAVSYLIAYRRLSLPETGQRLQPLQELDQPSPDRDHTERNS